MLHNANCASNLSVPGVFVYIYMHVHLCIHTQAQTYQHTCMHACMHACMHTYIHTHTHIHTCIHIYIKTLNPKPWLCHQVKALRRPPQAATTYEAPGAVGFPFEGFTLHGLGLRFWGLGFRGKGFGGFVCMPVLLFFSLLGSLLLFFDHDMSSKTPV